MNLKDPLKHESVSHQAELKRLAVEIAEWKDLFKTCHRKFKDIQKYNEVKGQHFLPFHLKLDP